ncbi:MAG: tRNA (guanosine(46)-N7)-methyltransferase TrmB, partial [Planctomycetota bacterium]
MGRRALPRLSPTIDVSGTLFRPETLPDPWSAAEVFGRDAPVEVEVGSGKGLFLAAASQRRPEHDFFGVEIAGKYARFAAGRLAKQGQQNARVLAGDALEFFRTVLPGGSLAAVHVYFPDPWWKKRHRRRRVMNEAFAADVTRTLAVGGRLHFWTDVREYFDATLDLLASTTPLDGPHEPPETAAEHDLDYRTHRERRVRQAGLPVYRSEFVKTA